jgi:hypothetical protein
MLLLLVIVVGDYDRTKLYILCTGDFSVRSVAANSGNWAIYFVNTIFGAQKL